MTLHIKKSEIHSYIQLEEVSFRYTSAYIILGKAEEIFDDRSGGYGLEQKLRIIHGSFKRLANTGVKSPDCDKFTYLSTSM